MKKITKTATVGGGVIGGGWVARFALAGADVSVFDPDPEAEGKITAIIDNAKRAQSRLWPGQTTGDIGAITFCDSIEEAVAEAHLIQESVPERIEMKRDIHRSIGQGARADAVIGSSTSGLLPSDFQAGSPLADRIMVAHPFNPVYLLPVVEIVGGGKTSDDAIATALEAYSAVGMKPIHIKKEIDAFVGDRLLEAMWRESIWLVNDGVATVEEIDDIVRYGLGLRYAQMGQFMTYRLGGGDAGMKHFLAQFGPTLAFPWTKLMDVPEWTDDLINTITAQSDAQAKGLSIAELTRIRDDNVVDFLKALNRNKWGAGALLQNPATTQTAKSIPEGPEMTTWQGVVDPDWADYNGHMTEFRYLEVFSQATDELLLWVGGGAGYVEASMGSWYTVETHIRHLKEIASGNAICVKTRLISHDSKRARLFHEMYASDKTLLATGEHMLIHVDMQTGRSADMPAEMARAIGEIAQKQENLPIPEAAGAAIGQRGKK